MKTASYCLIILFVINCLVIICTIRRIDFPQMGCKYSHNYLFYKTFCNFFQIDWKTITTLFRSTFSRSRSVKIQAILARTAVEIRIFTSKLISFGEFLGDFCPNGYPSSPAPKKIRQKKTIITKKKGLPKQPK